MTAPPPSHEEERLRHVLAFVDGHVRFAETKNAGLLAANAATLVAIVQVVTGDHRVGDALGAYLTSVTAGSLASGVVALLSFKPRLRPPKLRGARKHERGGNLLFFGDAQRFDGASYIEALLKATGAPRRDPTSFERMLADQIVINSKIATGKFTFFRIAIWCTLFGVLTPLLAGPLLLWSRHDDD